jgi:hypothetical protein
VGGDGEASGVEEITVQSTVSVPRSRKGAMYRYTLGHTEEKRGNISVQHLITRYRFEV